MSTDTMTPVGAKGSKAKTVALWAVTGLLACLFAFAGVLKFVSAEEAEQFAAWGYPDWFRVLIGAAEVAGGLGLLLPRTASLAAAGLGVVMVGAVWTHLGHGEIPKASVPFVILGLLAAVAYFRRPW